MKLRIIFVEQITAKSKTIMKKSMTELVNQYRRRVESMDNCHELCGYLNKAQAHNQPEHVEFRRKAEILDRVIWVKINALISTGNILEAKEIIKEMVK